MRISNTASTARYTDMNPATAAHWIHRVQKNRPHTIGTTMLRNSTELFARLSAVLFFIRAEYPTPAVLQRTTVQVLARSVPLHS